jgi:hypothetical protein
MELSVWLIVMATIAGPILAVQAQKMVERFRERRVRKLWIFHTLMATRANRTANEHVQALNMIDLSFYGSRIFWILRRTRKEQAVLDAWTDYRTQLNTAAQPDVGLWYGKCDELFINLLHAISCDTGFSFDRVQLKTGSYTPIAHGDLMAEQTATRKLWLEVLKGTRPLKMEITNLPVAPAKPPAQVDEGQHPQV